MEAELVEWREVAGSKMPIVAFMAGRFMDCLLYTSDAADEL